LAYHIKEGKAELNFNEFGNYSNSRQLSKLKAIGNSVKDGSMPLSSYTFLHMMQNFPEGNKALMIEWATRTRDSIEGEN
jgi:hypothetical protein